MKLSRKAIKLIRKEHKKDSTERTMSVADETYYEHQKEWKSSSTDRHEKGRECYPASWLLDAEELHD